jgi:Ni/Co efflux regulator RcnB
MELADFKRTYHSFKPLKKTNRKLYWWVKDQRAFFRENRLPTHRKQKLMEVGLFEGDMRAVSAKWDDIWETRFSELASFKEQHGHTFVPNKSNATLYAWVRSQRLAKSKGRLSDARKRRLDEIDFCWTGKMAEPARRKADGSRTAKRQRTETDDEEITQTAPRESSDAQSQTSLASPPAANHQEQLSERFYTASSPHQEDLGADSAEDNGNMAVPAKKSEGEVKDFLNMLSNQNKHASSTDEEEEEEEEGSNSEEERHRPLVVGDYRILSLQPPPKGERD